MSRADFKPNGRACYRTSSKYSCREVDRDVPARITPKRVATDDGHTFARDVYGRELAPIDHRVSSSYRRRLLWYQPDGGERVEVPGVATLPTS